MLDRRESLKILAGAIILSNTVPFTRVCAKTETDFFVETHIQKITINVDLGRTPIWELGRIPPYHRIANFPCKFQKK